MSIHVISAVLNCRDKELSSSRRMVLVCLANYAGEDGRAWPSQQLIADESGCGIRSVKDHLKWLEQAGFIKRKTKSLGQGNGSRTSYHISLARLSQTQDNAGAEFAGANIARAKSRTCEGSIPPLTNRQEPSVTEANASVRAKPAQPKSSARGTRLPKTWTPTPKDYAFASSEGLTREEINREADKFRDYWIAATGRNAAKLDWEATWRNWLRNRRTAGKTARPQSGGQPRGGGIAAAAMRSLSERYADRGTVQDGFDWRGDVGADFIIDGRTGTDG